MRHSLHWWRRCCSLLGLALLACGACLQTSCGRSENESQSELVIVRWLEQTNLCVVGTIQWISEVYEGHIDYSYWILIHEPQFLRGKGSDGERAEKLGFLAVLVISPSSARPFQAGDKVLICGRWGREHVSLPEAFEGKVAVDPPVACETIDSSGKVSVTHVQPFVIAYVREGSGGGIVPASKRAVDLAKSIIGADDLNK